MFEYLIGYVTAVNSSWIVLEVNQIGYVLHVANPQVYEVNRRQQIKVYVYQVVTDSYQMLYGFRSRLEKVLFQKLINVSGIGPKNAIVILSGNDQKALLNAIQNENVTYLTKFPGVGQKTAKQIILDLQGKLGSLAEAVPGSAASPIPQKTNPRLTEALQALVALGYRRQDVRSLTPQLARYAHQSTNQYLSKGLKLLNRLP